MISFVKDAPLSSKTSASLLSNLMYNLKLAHSVVLVPVRQFVIRRNMASNMIELINLNMRVNVIVMCSLMLSYFYSDCLIMFSDDCPSGGCCRSSPIYTS